MSVLMYMVKPPFSNAPTEDKRDQLKVFGTCIDRRFDDLTEPVEHLSWTFLPKRSFLAVRAPLFEVLRIVPYRLVQQTAMLVRPQAGIAIAMLRALGHQGRPGTSGVQRLNERLRREMRTPRWSRSQGIGDSWASNC